MIAMTTNTITLFPLGSGALTTPSVRPQVHSSPIDIYTLSSEKELSVDEMFAQLEANDSRAAGATELGIKWVAETFLADRTGLAALRMRAGLSQRALAERLGVSQPLVAKWEKGDDLNMQLNTVRRLAAALSVDVSALVELLINEH